MATMIRLMRLPCALAAALCCAAGLAADNILSINAQESAAQLEPRSPEQSNVRLPALDIVIVAAFQCPSASNATSLTVSVSDTHEAFGPEQLADVASLNAAFSVPARQLAPISIPAFCVGDKPIVDRELLVPGVASAQVSLRCGDADDASVYFASAPVPVRLYCNADADPESSSTER